MLIAFVGASGSGKSVIAKELVRNHNYKEIVSYTTRSMRPGEKDHKDYHFISYPDFLQKIEEDFFVEYDEYSQNRLYGTSVDSIKDAADSQERYAIVVTPNGLRKIEGAVGRENVFSIYLEAPLGVRVKRYIDRCGEEEFNFDDMNEINARVNRDFGMFLGMDKHADMVMHNDGSLSPRNIARHINQKIESETLRSQISWEHDMER